LSDGPTIRDCRECGMPFSPPVYPQRFCPDCKLKRDARDLMKKGIRDPMPSFDAPAGRACEHPDCGTILSRYNPRSTCHRHLEVDRLPAAGRVLRFGKGSDSGHALDRMIAAGTF
jgi:hypothetical protein